MKWYKLASFFRERLRQMIANSEKARYHVEVANYELHKKELCHHIFTEFTEIKLFKKGYPQKVWPQLDALGLKHLKSECNINIIRLRESLTHTFSRPSFPEEYVKRILTVVTIVTKRQFLCLIGICQDMPFYTKACYCKGTVSAKTQLSYQGEWRRWWFAPFVRIIC